MNVIVYESGLSTKHWKVCSLPNPLWVSRGGIGRVSGNQAIIMSSRQYIPVQFVTDSLNDEDAKRLDLALVWGGFGSGYDGGAGRGGYGRGF